MALAVPSGTGIGPRKLARLFTLVHHVPLIAKASACVVCITEPRSVFRNHIQHRLNIRRRAGDDAQDLTRRRLLLQRLFELIEKPHVLDGNDRLVGEGLQQLDLRRGEGAYFGATCDPVPNKFPLLTKRNG